MTRMTHDIASSTRPMNGNGQAFAEIGEMQGGAAAAAGRLHGELVIALRDHRDVQLQELNDRLLRELQASRAMLAGAQEERSRQTRFLAVLAHELRNPLTPIRTAAAVLERLPVGDPIVRQVGAVIERQSAHLSRLIEDLLDLSRVRTGKLRLDCRAIATTEFIDSAIDVCRPAIDGRNQSFVVRLPVPAPTVQGDATRLTQVFSNLLDNASKYTPAGGTIDLAIVVDGSSLTATVSDSGIGIAGGDLAAVFEPFVQDARAVGNQGTGLGIGLAVVRELVSGHGGSVVARSAGPGLGSQFVVVLPLLRHD